MNETPPRLPPGQPRQEATRPGAGPSAHGGALCCPPLLLCVAAMPAVPLLLEGRVENRLLLAPACLRLARARCCAFCAV